MKKISFFLVLLLSLAFLSLLPNALAEFKTPQTTVVIEEEAFMGNSSLSTITLNDGLKRIESNAFSNCDLQEAHLPASVEYIAEDAFDGNSNMILYAPNGSYAWKWAIDHYYWFDWNVEASYTDCYTVTWEPIDGISQYIVYVFTDEALQDLYVSYTFEDTNIGYVNTDVGTRYYFVVGFVYDNHYYTQPNLPGYIKTVDPIVPIRAPENLHWEICGDISVGISWDPIDGVDGYRFYWSESPDWTISTDWISSYDSAWGGIDLSNPGIQMNGFSQNDTIYIWVCADNYDGPNSRAAETIHFVIDETIQLPKIGSYYYSYDSDDWQAWIRVKLWDYDNKGILLTSSGVFGNEENEYSAWTYWDANNKTFPFVTTDNDGNIQQCYLTLDENDISLSVDGWSMLFSHGTPVTSVSLSSHELILTSGETMQLIPAIYPTEATYQKLYWYSNDESIAVVDQNGQISAVGSGIAYIFALSYDNSNTPSGDMLYDYCQITVNP